MYGKIESRVPMGTIKEMYDVIDKNIKVATRDGSKSIILGDFNAKIGHVIPGNSSIINNSGKLLKTLVKDNNLKILNATDKCRGLWTRRNTRNDAEKSVIDYVLCSDNLFNDIEQMVIDDERNLQFTKYCIFKNKLDIVESDHYTITVELNIKISGDSKTSVITVNKKDPKGWNKFREKCENSKLLNNTNNRDVNDMDKVLNHFLLKTANSCFKKVKIKNKCYVPRNVKEAINKKKTLKKLLTWQKNNKDNEAIITQIKIKWVNKEIAILNNEYKMNKVKEITEKLVRSKGIHDSEFWKLKRKILSPVSDDAYPVKNKQNILCYEQEDQKQAFKEHYQDILQTRALNKNMLSLDDDINMIFNRHMCQANLCVIKEFSTSEIKQVIRELGKSKAAGTNEVTYEMIKNGGQNVILYMCKLFNQILESKTIPEEWLKVAIKSIYKNKGKKEDLKNQRGLFLTQTTSKIFEKLILKRIRPNLENNMTDFQNGARTGRSSSDNLFLLRAIIDYYQYYNVPLYIVFYDLEKCFDRLWLKDCMIDLWESGVRGTLWQMIYELNSVSKVVVRTPLGPTDEFCANQIVKQGTILAARVCANTVDK